MPTHHIIQVRDLVEMLMRFDMNDRVVACIGKHEGVAQGEDSRDFIINRAVKSHGRCVIHVFGDDEKYDALENRAIELDNANEKLNEEKSKLEAQVAELTQKLDTIRAAITPSAQVANG